MRNKVVLIYVFVTIFPSIAGKSNAQTPLIDSLINTSSLREVVEILAADSLEGRFTGTANAKKAAAFIAGEFEKAGLDTLAGIGAYYMPFVIPGENTIPGINVVGGLKGVGKPDELIIFCAHYDHVGTKSTNPINVNRSGRTRPGDTIYNGANDNASGVSALIHLARYFGRLTNNERSIIFIAFSGEELGLKGSEKAVSFFKPEEVVAVINIEMIGRPITKKKRKAFITGSHLSDVQKLLNKKLYATNPGFYGKKFFISDPFADANLFSRSDNYWFAMTGIPSHTIMATSPNDEYYHSTADELATIDFALMENLVKAIAISSTILVDGTARPSRIRPHRIEARF